MEPNESAPPELRELHDLLRRLLLRVTRRAWATPREMQMDASRAIGLLPYAPPSVQAQLTPTLSGLIRELGQKRPDLYRHIVTLERVVVHLDERFGPPPSAV
ncbi:MAG: hypothetical protein JO040_11025 [Gemmatimonadetes bacterium]|nr:hypothetical protein [Gemmatimonadota bacterium]